MPLRGRATARNFPKFLDGLLSHIGSCSLEEPQWSMSTMVEKGPLSMLEKSPPLGYEAMGASGFLSKPAFCFSRKRYDSPLMLMTTL
jgi:hypothetical protein